MNVARADDASFADAVASRHGELVVAYFHGAGCPACDAFGRALPALARSLADECVTLVEVDVAQAPEVTLAHGVFAVPAFHLYREGRRIGRVTERPTPDLLADVIRDNLPPAGRGPRRAP